MNLRGKELENYKRSLRLNEEQEDVLIGSMLGDGNIRFPGRSTEASFVTEHGAAQREYVFWKYKIFQSFVLTQPKMNSRIYHKDQKRILTSWRFITVSHPIFTKYAAFFYQGRTKVVPPNIEEILKSPRALAVWLMDDGNKNARAVFLNTQNFTVEDQHRLISCLKNNFGLEARLNLHSNWHGRKLYRLRLTTEATKKLSMLVRSYLLQSLQYKLPV
jgi:hypothetical protein